MEAAMEAVSKSISGRRSQNEDATFCWSGEANGDSCAIIAVADGMGGHSGGQEASRLVVEAIRSAWSELLEDGRAAENSTVTENGSAAEDSSATEEGSAEEESGFEPGRAWLKAVVEEASRAVSSYQNGQEELSEMGTTLTVALAWEGRVLFANVGDSRTYLATESELLQVTEDHSAIAEAVRGGKINEEEAQELPYQDALTRSIGGGGSRPEPDLFPPSAENAWRGYPVEDGWLVLPGCCFLLSCSDGLTKGLTDIEIYECLRHTPSLEEAARQLVATAYRKGSADNVTVAALEHGDVQRLKPYRSKDPLPEKATRPAEAPSPNGSSGSGNMGSSGNSGQGREANTGVVAEENRGSSRVLWGFILVLAALLFLLVGAYVWEAYDLPLQIP